MLQIDWIGNFTAILWTAIVHLLQNSNLEMEIRNTKRLMQSHPIDQCLQLSFEQLSRKRSKR